LQFCGLRTLRLARSYFRNKMDVWHKRNEAQKKGIWQGVLEKMKANKGSKHLLPNTT
jgi:hypothetical protein